MTDAIEAGAREIYHSIPERERTNSYGLLVPFERCGGRDQYRVYAKACIEAAIASGALVPASAVAEARHMTLPEREAMERATADLDAEIRIASAVAEMRERCAKVADNEATEYEALIDKGKGEYGQPGYVRDDVWTSWNADYRKSQEIASAIRRLDLAPASGDYVVGWRDISTAPKDGTLIDLWISISSQDDQSHGGERIANACWANVERSRGKPDRFGWGLWNDEWGDYFDLESSGKNHCRTATHWQPLPTPPAMLNAATRTGGEK